MTAKALTEVAPAWAKAKPLAAAPVPANTVYAGVGSTTAILGFFPQVLKVKAGTTVTFVNRSPTEVHNVAFGPEKYLLAFSKKTDLLPQGPTSPNQVDPALSVRHRAEGRLQLRRGEPRQRVPVDATLGGVAEGAAAEVGQGHVHEGRDVQVHLLPARQRHGRNGDRHAVTTTAR